MGPGQEWLASGGTRPRLPPGHLAPRARLRGCRRSRRGPSDPRGAGHAACARIPPWSGRGRMVYARGEALSLAGARRHAGPRKGRDPRRAAEAMKQHILTMGDQALRGAVSAPREVVDLARADDSDGCPVRSRAPPGSDHHGIRRGESLLHNDTAMGAPARAASPTRQDDRLSRASLWPERWADPTRTVTRGLPGHRERESHGIDYP